MKNVQFINGSLAVQLIVELLNEHSQQFNTGAYSIFCGQVRADAVENINVKGIEYTSYESMALAILKEKTEEVKQQYDVQHISIFHSKGFVPVGGLSVIIFITSSHRKQALAAQEALLPIIKFEVPIWKKEIFEDHSSRWA
jgi:molybdopterin synthase catalytic subunit